MIYALKVDSENTTRVFNSLSGGEGRFGWSYCEDANLHQTSKIIETEGWEALNKDQQACYQGFLLDLEPDDYVVYINMPEYGKCTLAKVTEGYFWSFDDNDFNHRFKVDKNSIQTFNRNSESVHPSLRARLKLQGKYWRIYTQKEFDDLIKILESKNGVSDEVYTIKSNINFLNQYIQPHLVKITEEIHKANPNYDLERLLENIFENIPSVIEVKRQGGAGDNGADLIVTYRTGLPIAGLEKAEKLVVQVKSYAGEHHDVQAVKDIVRACNHYTEIKMGLIISTATEISANVQNAIEVAQKELDIPISIIYGAELARFILQNDSLRS